MADDDDNRSTHTDEEEGGGGAEDDEEDPLLPFPSSFTSDIRTLPTFNGDNRKGSISTSDFFRVLDVYASDHLWDDRVKKAALYRKCSDYARTLINNSLDITYATATFDELKTFLIIRCTSSST
jgi:hypothetical protein